MATHIEDICQGEAQAIEEMELDEQYDQKNNFHITGINFGLTTQNIMKYLVEIYNCVKKIAMLKTVKDESSKTSFELNKENKFLYSEIVRLETENEEAYESCQVLEKEVEMLRHQLVKKEAREWVTITPLISEEIKARAA